MNYIKEITIYLKTNANIQNQPDKSGKGESGLHVSNEGYVPLTYSMIVVPPPPNLANKKSKKILSFQYNKTPYFTNYIKYSSSLKSYLLEQGYEEVLKFFFNLSHFKEVLKKIGILVNPAISESDRNQNSQGNIEFMIGILFPTTFPAYNNMISSYDDIFKGNAVASANTTVTMYDYLPKYVKELVSTTNKYSYINIGGGIHTIYRVVVINDIINHPKFNFLIDKVHAFFEEFDKERDGVIASLINRFSGLLEILDYLEGNLEYIHVLNQTKQGQMEELSGFKYREIFTELDNMKISVNGKIIAKEKEVSAILKPILKESQKNSFFGKLKQGLEEIMKYSNEFDSYALKNRQRLSLENTSLQSNAKVVSEQDISRIKDFLKYYEVYHEYYQYDAEYTKFKVPLLKNIFYNAGSKKRSGYESSYSRMRRYDSFDVKTEAKDLIQQDRSMSNYRTIFETLKSVSFDTILTDNTDFNNILRTYVDVEAEPDTFLLYLYESLALLQPQKDTTLASVLVKDGDIARKLDKNEIENYCKMTVMNTMEKKEKSKKVVTGSYSVYIQVDLIAGKLDDTNLGDVRCKYTGEQLGNMYRRLSSVHEFWEVDTLPYLKLSNILDKPVKTGRKVAGPKGMPVKRSQTRRNPVGQMEGGNRWYKQKYPVRHTRKRHTRVL
jgi:hypothetical protein